MMVVQDFELTKSWHLEHHGEFASYRESLRKLIRIGLDREDLEFSNITDGYNGNRPGSKHVIYGTSITFGIDFDTELRVEKWIDRQGWFIRNMSSALRFLIFRALDVYGPRTALDNVEAGEAVSAEPPLLLPPPAPEPAATPTLSDLAALIRKTAETNPFVRPLADFIDGRI